MFGMCKFGYGDVDVCIYEVCGDEIFGVYLNLVVKVEFECFC